MGRLLCLCSLITTAHGFGGATSFAKQRTVRSLSAFLSGHGGGLKTRASAVDHDQQWELFKEHHSGKWSGYWETYDNIGDKIDAVESVFEVQLDAAGTVAEMTQTLPIESKEADCETCFDSVELKRMPLGAVSAGEGGLRRMAVAGPGLVNGPTVLRSGAMSTEVALRHGDGRIRVTFQHVPAWKQDREQGVGLPDALGLYRVVVRREALRPRAPTKANEKAEAEAAKAEGAVSTDNPLNPNEGLIGPPVFWRGVPPFKWAEEGEVYSGHTHTWVPGEGLVSEPKQLDEPDERWHERFQVEGVWHLRLGAILIQCPTRIFANLDEALAGYPLYSFENGYKFRVAWLPEEGELKRADLSVRALESITDEDGETYSVQPPTLVSATVDEYSRPHVVAA